MSMPTKAIRSYLPWAVAFTVWLILSLVGSAALRSWHVRERQTVEDQAYSLVHALATTFRTMSGRASRSEVELRQVFEEVAATPAIDGVGLMNAGGEWVANIGIPPETAGSGRALAKGASYLGDTMLVWDTVNVGACAGYGMGGRGGGGHGWGRQGGRQQGAETPEVRTEPLMIGKLYVSVPVATLHARWHRDYVVAIVLGGLLLAVMLGLVKLAKLWKRSAQDSAQLQVAEEEKRALSEINLLAAGLAHEIRNPLGIVRGSAQRLAGRTGDAQETAAASDLIIQEIDRITGRLNELLAFARPRAPVLADVSVADVADELRALLADELTDTGLSLQGPEPGVRIRADRERLRQVFFNLIHNAIRFAAHTGAVTVETRTMADGTARITVRDHGPGVSPQVRASLFSPYVTTAAGGSGLGLAIARRLCRAHGWTIVYRDAEGGGALFEIGNVPVAISAGGTEVNKGVAS